MCGMNGLSQNRMPVPLSLGLGEQSRRRNVAGHEQDPTFRKCDSELQGQLDAVHFWHHYVRDEEMGRRLAGCRQSIFRTVHRARLIAVHRRIAARLSAITRSSSTTRMCSCANRCLQVNAITARLTAVYAREKPTRNRYTFSGVIDPIQIRLIRSDIRACLGTCKPRHCHLYPGVGVGAESPIKPFGTDPAPAETTPRIESAS